MNKRNKNTCDVFHNFFSSLNQLFGKKIEHGGGWKHPHYGLTSPMKISGSGTNQSFKTINTKS